MRLAIIITLALLTVGCGNCARAAAKWNGYSEICVDGVTYLQFTSGAAVKVGKDGDLVRCN